MKTLTPTRFQYNLSLLNGGSTTVRVEQKVNGVYQYLATQQTQTSSGTYELSFVPNYEDIRISVSGTSRYALNNLYLDRDQIDTLVATYALSRGYRYGSDSYRNQGMEKDDEVKGAGNSVNYEYRMHDPRIGRFFAVDPLTSKYPFYSPYAFSGNRVIDAVELEGLEPRSVNPGIDYLFIVILGYEGDNPPKGKTQNENNPYSQSDYDTQVQKNGLTEIENNFNDNSNVEVVVFSSSDISDRTVSDVVQTMNVYMQNNPNGKIVLVGHSLGAINAIDAATSSKQPIHFMYTIDLLSTGMWDSDNIPSNVEYFINVYQKKSWPARGESVDINNEDKTIGFNHKAYDMNLSHTTIDNIYSDKVINRLERIINNSLPLTSKEITTFENNRESKKKIREHIGTIHRESPKY